MTSLVHYVLHYGIPLIFINVLLEQLGAPVPAVPALIVAGALSRDGRMSSTHVLLAALVVVVCLLALVIAVKWAQRVHFLKQLRLARIEPHDLKAMLDRGELPVVLDVRSPGARKHNPRAIPTAILAQMDDIDSRLGDLAPHQEVVLYCT